MLLFFFVFFWSGPAPRARCRPPGSWAGQKLVKPCGPQHGIPVPDPRLPGPGAGYPAAGPAVLWNPSKTPKRPVFDSKKHFQQIFFFLPGPARLPGPVPATRLPGPGAGCRLPGRPFLRFFFRKNCKNCSTDSRDQNKIPQKKLLNIQKKNAKFLSADFRPFFFVVPLWPI